MVSIAGGFRDKIINNYIEGSDILRIEATLSPPEKPAEAVDTKTLN